MKTTINLRIFKRYSNKGMTLIEVLIFIVLLSSLMTGFLQYIFVIQNQNIQLINEINDSENL